MKSVKVLGLVIVAGMALAAGLSSCKKQEAPAAAPATETALPAATTAQMNVPAPAAPAAPAAQPTKK